MSADDPQRYSAVPQGRFGRLARMGRLTGGMAARAAWDGAQAVARGERPRLESLILTPANATRLAAELATMRGAAMKLGQLVSMDAGEVLPPEFAEILSRLRQDAQFMPPAQLKQVLAAEWGADFLRRFKRFDTRPIAAASIGQVHRAETRDGRDLAIKVQYPGIRASIDSDIRNLGALIRRSGALPRGLDLAPFLEAARVQLHEEADYAREAANLARFGALLADDPDFAVPSLQSDLTTRNILAMDFLPGQPIETLAAAPQAERDGAAAALTRLMLREVFEFGLVQSDPNFANYRVDPETGRIALLDFGAVLALDAARQDDFRALLEAVLKRDDADVKAGLIRAGYLGADDPESVQALVMSLAQEASTRLLDAPPLDFGRSRLIADMAERGVDLGRERNLGRVPPLDALFLQRKAAGLYLLFARIGARMDVGEVLDNAP